MKVTKEQLDTLDSLHIENGQYDVFSLLLKIHSSNSCLYPLFFSNDLDSNVANQVDLAAIIQNYDRYYDITEEILELVNE